MTSKHFYVNQTNGVFFAFPSISRKYGEQGEDESQHTIIRRMKQSHLLYYIRVENYEYFYYPAYIDIIDLRGRTMRANAKVERVDRLI